MNQRRKKNKKEGHTVPKSERKAGGRKRTFAALSIIIIGILVLLSILSFTPADEVVSDVSVFDLWKVFSGDDVVRAKADRTQNWLGLAGALISFFLIRTTFGYTVIVLPLLMVAWGWYLLRKRDTKKLLVLTNYAMVILVLASAFFGVIRLMGEDPVLTMSWSGGIGDYVAGAVSQLLGLLGATIVLFSLLFFALIFAVDLDLQRSFDRLRHIYARVYDWIVRKNADRRTAAAERKQERELERTTAIKTATRTGSPKEPIIVKKRDEISAETPHPSRQLSPAAFPETGKVLPEDNSDEFPHKEKSEKTVEQSELDMTIHEKIIEEEVDENKSSGRTPIGGDIDEEIDYVFPSVELLDAQSSTNTVEDEELKANADLLRTKLADFGVEVESVSVTPGPVLTLYELVPATGVKISRIVSLANDLALALQARGIRIIAPIPGKGTVGVEIPNHNPSIVTFRSVVNSKRFHDSKFALPMAMGKNISGEVFVDDLARLPHLLIAGSTGSGKSVGINTIISSFLFRLHPSDVKFVIIDPKKIELTAYRKLEKHYLAISPDINEKIATTAQNAVTMLRGVEIEMEKRYDMLAVAGVRNIQDYNTRLAEGRIKQSAEIKHKKLPYVIVIIDELADLMLTAAKEVEDPIARLAQLARAVGIHLIVATQRPSVDVITGVIKANFSARIAYAVASKTDSRTILDTNGAEQLLGNGDMLYLPSGSPKPIRMQNAFISSDEVERLTSHVKNQPGYSRPYQLPSIVERKKNGFGGESDSRDELFEEAAQLVVRHQQGSVSLIQRRLKVGYSRAARIIDELEAAGIVGPYDGSKARQVLVETESELELILESLNS
jgi:DNA segregation ATPase FtsK/SpoIIIE, S-DNA-T family